MMIKVKNVSGKVWYLFDCVMVSSNCPYTPTRAEMRRLFVINACAPIYVFKPNGNLVAFAFRPATRRVNAFSMGCQFFDAKNGAIIRRWALDSFKL